MIHMFTVNHFIWLVICAVAIGGLLFCSLKFKWSLKTSTFVVAGISLTSELCKIFTHIDFVNGVDWAKGGVISPGALPFHLCSILIFIWFFVALAKPSKLTQILLDFATPVAIIGGILALFIPTSGVDFAKPYAYQCFVYHSGIVWYAAYLLATKQVKLTLKVYLRDLGILFALCILMIWINGALKEYDTNFFYVVRPPMSGLPFLTLKYGWYVYFIHLSCAAVILFTIVSLPNMIQERIEKRAK